MAHGGPRTIHERKGHRSDPGRKRVVASPSAQSSRGRSPSEHSHAVWRTPPNSRPPSPRRRAARPPHRGPGSCARSRLKPDGPPARCRKGVRSAGTKGGDAVEGGPARGGGGVRRRRSRRLLRYPAQQQPVAERDPAASGVTYQRGRSDPHRGLGRRRHRLDADATPRVARRASAARGCPRRDIRRRHPHDHRRPQQAQPGAVDDAAVPEGRRGRLSLRDLRGDAPARRPPGHRSDHRSGLHQTEAGGRRDRRSPMPPASRSRHALTSVPTGSSASTFSSGAPSARAAGCWP